jgi:4-hydroxy-4-methyl-2-oxoglutarate aldolase
MRTLRTACTVGVFVLCLNGQILTLNREEMIRATPRNPFPRFEDGRPKAPDDLLKKMQGLTLEDVYGVLRSTEYRNQYEGKWLVLRPEMKIIGRAVTLQYMPARPDLAEIIDADAAAKGLARGAHRWAVDKLQSGDVLVIDVFGNLDSGGPIGDNLATAIYTFGKAGLVVDGAVRDLEGVARLPMPVFCRAGHPAAVNNVMATGYNIPVRIGGVTVMPGDVVFGDREGLYFIPPQFVEEIVRTGEVTHIHDEWTQMKMKTGKYKPSDLYPNPIDPELKKEYEEYLRKRLGK